MSKIRDFIRERIECLEAARKHMVEDVESQLKLFPSEFHDKYRNSYCYLKADLRIKLCELVIEIWKAWKALIGGKEGVKE